MKLRVILCCGHERIPCATTYSQTIYAVFFIIKPTRCTIFPNLLWHETLHVSGSSSAHHREFIHHTLGTGICHTGLKSHLQTCMTYTSAECTVNKLLMMGRGAAQNM